ncbi:uroporphyrinogen-III synthase, partial [Mycobacterium tuberculosis]|nr:uroporphyrinogen-III synthase [Mycobacterium tuberculosis]
MVFTSANAVRALARRPDLSRWQSVPVVAVGKATAAAARAAGFVDVVSADGRAADVATAVRDVGLPPGSR